jgi:FO synthase
MLRTRALQRETGGFTEFVPLPYVHMAAPMYLQGKSRRGPTFRESMLMHSVARIVYAGCIDNIQVSWVKLGGPGAGQLLAAGANDLGGTLMDENISRAAGASHGQMMDEAGFSEIVGHANAIDTGTRRLVQRTTLYGRLATA